MIYLRINSNFLDNPLWWFSPVHAEELLPATTKSASERAFQRLSNFRGFRAINLTEGIFSQH